MSLGWRRSRDPTPQEDSGLLATLTALFGLLAGFATLVYIGGGSIMALRLEFARLPNPTAVASRLAREVLISVGLTLIVGPALLVFIVYASWRIATAYDGKVADIPRNWPIALAGGAFLLCLAFCGPSSLPNSAAGDSSCFFPR